MGALAKKLTEFRRQEQEMRGYAASSRWYTGLSNAIHFLERAEGEGDYLDRFRDAWSAAYNLFMMHGKAGDDEHKCFNRWVTALKEVPSVRRFFSESYETAPFSVFKANVKKAQKTLLKLQGQQELYAWDAKPASADKACRYFLTICRDIRNTCSHPDFNPKAAAIKKALTSAADCLVPVVAAAIRGTIEHPVEGTTGRTTAYRSFLWPFLKNSDSFFSDYYLEKLFPEEELEAFTEDVARTSLKTIARQIASMRSGLINADADETKEKWCKQVLFPVLGATLKEGVRIVTEDGVSQPTFVLPVADLKGGPRTEYHGKDAGRDLACLTWVLPWKTSLDSVAIDPEFKNLPVIEMTHKVLNLSDVPWAVLTNGRKLRLLSKRTAHKPRCFLEIDLQALADRRGDAEARQAFRYFLGLFSAGSFTEKDDQDNTRLDRVLTGSERHGKEIGDELKQNVFKALEKLGDGFLHYLRSISPDELDMWREEKASSLSLEEYLASDQLLTEIYHESLSLMYRLLFLFYAESRNLLPMDDEMYRETYSLESIRDDIISIHDDPDTKRFFGKGHADLWDRLEELFVFVNKGWRNVIPAYNGGLFDPDLHEFLERFKVDDYHLARAIDLLSRTKPRAGQARGEGRKKVTYRDLDIRHLGSIYEGILEYAAQIADHDLVVLKRGSGNKVYEEYVPVSQLKSKEKEQFMSWQKAKEENPENPKPPRGCKIMGEKTSGQYFLVYGGRESKRKSSGSYYTPDYIVQYIVENTLGPLVRGECKPKSEPLSEELKKLSIKDEPAPTGRLTSDEILELKVLDPAMGSGHFLVAATEYLARAYGEALIREGKDDDGMISDDEFIRYKRIVAERCIYGVDINPVAVELAKLSMWLFTMDKGRPLSFLDHHLKCGNSLIGAWIKDLGALPEFDKKGRPKKVEPEKVPATQMNLFETRLKEKLPLMIRDLLGIMKNETLTPDDIKLKKGLDKAVADIKRPFKNIADAWVGTYFGDEVRDYDTLLSNVSLARGLKSKAAEEHRFFHWEMEFPEVWFDNYGSRLTEGGFTAIIGNPPYDVLASKELRRDISFELNFFKDRHQFSSAIKGKNNLYKLFIAFGFSLSGRSTMFSFIVPMPLLGDDQASGLRREILSEETSVVRLEVFPQKDDPTKRVFPEAKLSTTIFILHEGRPHRHFIVRTHPGGTIEDSSPTLRVYSSEIRQFDNQNLAIPTCTQRDWDIVISILKQPICRLREVAKSKQGEINETLNRSFLSNKPNDSHPVLRGSAISLYCVREASQGTNFYLDTDEFLRTASSGTKAQDHRFLRVGFQRSSPQNNFRRLIAAPISPGMFCFDTVSYVTYNDTSLDLRYLLAYLNSEIADWYFRIGSAGSKINEYQFNALPLPTESSPAGVDWKPLFKNNNWSELLSVLTRACKTPGLIPADIVDALSACSATIVREEAQRKLRTRSERSSLCSKSQSVQNVIDNVFFRCFGLSASEREYVRLRRSQML